MKKTEKQKEQILKDLWYKRNPCHDKDQNGVDRFWGTVLCVFEDYNKALTIPDVSQQRELLEWLSNEDYFNIPKDEIDEILEDWQIYKSNCG